MQGRANGSGVGGRLDAGYARIFAQRPRVNIGRLDGGVAFFGGSKHLAALRLHFLYFVFDGFDDVINFLDLFEEIADVQEGVAIEADIHKGRLHARQHARHAAFVNASD